jgi:pimeloyl-ACP methyl ester carboxylesterase
MSIVIALACSGGSGKQWRQLGAALGPACRLATPEHYGSPPTGPWTRPQRFTLADEAARTIALIDRSADEVHLVGHSYGGAVALHVALARPERIASLALYEPSAFHLLRAMGAPGAAGAHGAAGAPDDGAAAAFAEIAALARETQTRVLAGELSRAAAGFVDYWNGRGAWAALAPETRSALVRWMPKAPLDFRALIDEPTDLATYARLRMPVLVMHGEHAPRPARAIAARLPDLLPCARLVTVAGAGHMGPLTHAAAVNALIVDHVAPGIAAATPAAPTTPALATPALATIAARREPTRGLLARFFPASWSLAGSRS